MKILNSQKDKAIEQVEKVLNELKAMPDKSPIQEIDKEGLESLLGEVVTLFGAVYIYTGKLVGVNSTCVKLENAGIVYETGDFNEKNWKDMQKLPHKYFYIQISMIESFGLLK